MKAAPEEGLMRHKVISTLIVILIAGHSQLVAQSNNKKAAGDLINSLKSARVIELNFIWDSKSPILSLNPPFAIGLHSSHKETAGMIPGGIAYAEDMMFFSGQHGAPTIDALGHISNNGKLFGGLDAVASESSSGLLALGIEVYPKDKFINRAVLLDVARFKNVDALDAGQEITAEDLQATAKAEGVEIGRASCRERVCLLV